MRRLSGGRRNRSFAWDGPGGEICLKLYASGDHDRAIREYRALVHLAESGITAVPQPLWHDPNPELSAVATTMLPGLAVPGLDEPVSALRAMVAVLSDVRRVPAGPFADTPRVGAARDIAHRLMGAWSGQLDDHLDDPDTYDMRASLDAWSECGAVTTLLDPAPRIFSRGDSSLSNWLWDGSNARVAGWEFAGYSEAAYDAADIIEHPSARAIDDARWISLLPDLRVSDEDSRRRFLAAQRTVALHWLSRLWQRRVARAEEFEAQRARVRNLLDHDFL